ncbi:MAG: hypothetical protein HYU86_11295 [Chloroflexi bacterium]|nr:hypothetical protein [Chloroflexota bacterium]
MRRLTVALAAVLILGLLVAQFFYVGKERPLYVPVIPALPIISAGLLPLFAPSPSPTSLSGSLPDPFIALAVPPVGMPPVITPTASPTPLPTFTPTPRPTPPLPTPVPTPTPRKPVEKITKIGVGIYNHGGGHDINMLFRLKPTIILLTEPDMDFAKEVRHWFPKSFIVGRRFVTQQPLDNPQERGRQFADYVAQLAVPLRGYVDAWVSYNEPISAGNYEDYKAYNAFQVAFARRLQGTHGIAAVAGNDAVGVIQPQDYARYFAEAIGESRYFALHAYAPPRAASLRQDAEWFVLRYRLVHKALQEAGVRHGPMILTESGLWAGWRGVVNDEQMARDFVWLTDELEKDPYVLGHAIFGIFDNGTWPDFDISNTSILDRLGEYQPPPLGGS